MTTTNPKESRSKEVSSTQVTAQVKKPNYEIRVGIFAIIAVLLLLYGWTWLKSFSLFHPPQFITVQFQDIAGLASNAPVNINGVRVGTVDQIDLKGKGQVLCKLRIKTEEVVVPQGSNFTIQTLGLVGAKYIEISLPEERAGSQPPPPIDPNTVVLGQDPVRVELVMNKIATNLNHMISRMSDEGAQSSLVDALRNSGETIRSINEAANKLNENMDKVADAADSFANTSDKIAVVADDARAVSTSAKRFFDNGSSALGNVSSLTDDLKQTSGKVNKLLDNPDFSKDLKETADLAKQMAESINKTANEISTTLKDKPMREDLLKALENVNQSTKNIYESIKVIDTMKDDQTLRADLKEVVQDARQAMDKLDNIISDPEFKTDLKTTVSKINSAAGNVDTAAKQMKQVMGKRAPLLQMMFMRPGKLKGEKPKEKNSESSDPQKMGDRLHIPQEAPDSGR